MDVEITEGGCIFAFNYAKVYWNSRLETEHRRLVSLFKPGEVVCDVMAGIGPFAVPAGKRGVFVWANDMNPESFRYLETAIQKNKVSAPEPILLEIRALTKSRSTNSSAPSTKTAASSSTKQPTTSSQPPSAAKAQQ